MTSNPEPTRHVDAIANRYVEEYAALNPVDATSLGIPGHDDRLTDLSPDGYAERDAARRAALAAVEAASPVDEREQVAKDAFIERLGLEQEMADAGILQSQVSVISSSLHEVRSVFDLMDKDSEQAWANIDARLAAIPDALSDYRATLLVAADAGRVSAQRQYHEVASQVRHWTGKEGAGKDFFTALVDEGLDGRAEVSQTLRRQLEEHATAASAAVADFGDFLATELAPRGRAKDAVGRDVYTLCSRYFLGARVDLDETYAWGWDELARIDAQMAAVADTIAPGGSVEDAVSRLDEEPARKIESKDAYRDWMQQLADRTIEQMHGVHFDIPEPVRRIECCIAPTDDGGVYYTGPSEDFHRPGRMWWSVPAGIDTFSTWREVSTVYHEGVPGHHLQIAQTAYRSELLNRWQRLMSWVSGHGEGWALYAERLMDDLGYLDDPGDKLGMLDSQGFRAARVIVDIGLHCELQIPADNPFGFHPGETWTPDLVLEFIRAHCRSEDEVVRFEVNRYLGWPGQAPAYKVGERIWLEAREAARQRRGDAFDLKAFHRQALDLGSLGLDPLRAALARL